MLSQKSPGTGGLPAEFYTMFWDVLRCDLIDIINVSNRQNLIAKSMPSAILTLAFKGKDSSRKNDRLYLKNWRPISLLNIYYKIGAKGPANCLQNVLYHVINPDQTVQNPTQGMWLGFKEGQTTGPVDIQWTNLNNKLKLLGISFGSGSAILTSWRERISKLEKCLNAWQHRELSLQGKS